MVSALDLGAEGFNSHSALSNKVYKWEPANCFGDNLTKHWEVTCNGVISHPGGVEILLVASYYRNWR